MQHPEILLLPVLMLADYYGTILGAIQREKQYGKHFKLQHYEMNPAFQSAIAHRRWFSPKHLMLTLFFSAALIFVVEVGRISDNAVQGILGFIYVLYGSLLGRHLANLLIFSHLILSPREVSGTIHLSHPYVLSLSLYQSLMVAVPVSIMAIFTPTYFTRGGALGLAYFLFVHLVWIWNAKRQSPAARDSETAGAE